MIPHPESVSAELLELLPVLAGLEELRSTALGDGTSLALVFGHRKSVDIDLFLVNPFDSLGLQGALAGVIPGIQIVNRTKGSLCAINGSVKIDILHHAYPLLQDYSKFDVIPFLSLPDIAAMKVNAVTNRGLKKGFLGSALVE